MTLFYYYRMFSDFALLFFSFLSWLSYIISAALPSWSLLWSNVCAATADLSPEQWWMPRPSLYLHSPYCLTFSAKHYTEFMNMKELCDIIRYHVISSAITMPKINRWPESYSMYIYTLCVLSVLRRAVPFEGSWLSVTCVHGPAWDAKCCVIECCYETL